MDHFYDLSIFVNKHPQVVQEFQIETVKILKKTSRSNFRFQPTFKQSIESIVVLTLSFSYVGVGDIFVVFTCDFGFTSGP